MGEQKAEAGGGGGFIGEEVRDTAKGGFRFGELALGLQHSGELQYFGRGERAARRIHAAHTNSFSLRTQISKSFLRRFLQKSDHLLQLLRDPIRLGDHQIMPGINIPHAAI